MSEFGNNVKRLRKKEKLTQRDLASMLDVSKSTVGNWEASNTLPDAEGLEAVADFFGVPVYALFKEHKESWEGEASMERVWRITIDKNGFDAVMLVRGTEKEMQAYLKSELGYIPAYIAIADERYEAYRVMGFKTYISPKLNA